VTYNDQTKQYQVAIHSAVSVPEFGPLLPPEGKFTNHTKFREFLLTKCKLQEVYMYCVIISWKI
jgi:hypothetical protein